MGRKPTIFSLLDTPAFGGAEEYLFQLLSEFVIDDFNVVLAINNQQVKKEIAKRIREKGLCNFTLTHLPYRLDAIGNWKGLLKYFLGLPSATLWIIRKMIIYKQPICLFPGFTDRLSFSPWVKLCGCRLIWLEYGPLEPTFARNFGFPKMLYAIGRPFVDTVITISNATKKSLVNTGNIPEQKIRLLYPSVEVPSIQDVKIFQKKAKTILATLGVSGEIVVTVARLAHEKEIDLLIRAWADSKRNETLVIIGDGPAKEELQQLTTDLNIKNVFFTGFITDDNKKALLSVASLFIFPSSWNLEGFGMTTIEAMAFGIPVLTSGSGPQAEIVTDGTSGWYFKPHDQKDLAKKIQDIFKNPKKNEIARVGKNNVQSVFSKTMTRLAVHTFSKEIV